MSKRTKVTFSLILVICLLLSGLPNAAAIEVDEALASPITESTATETQDVTEQTAAVTEETPVLQLDADCQIFSHVDPEVFAAGNHIARLPEQETLSSYVFLNADGSQTVYYMDQPVKFEKADGTVVDKNLTLTAATEGYTTTQNDIQLTIPTNPTNGIRLVYDNHQITLIPQSGTLTNAAQATDSSVTYPDYYGEGMSLRYTPTLSGVKEDILLDAYSGVNSFTFRLNTGGLNLYQANGRYFLAESKVSTDRIELGEVVSYDAKSKFSIGTMTAQTIMPGQAYMLTLTVDEAFLTDENTTYPVAIDPTLTVSYSNNGDNYIIDAPIFEGYPSKNYGAFQYNRVGYVDSSYQSGRTVVKLPVLTSSSIYSSLTADNITSVKFYVKEATGSSGIPVVLYPLTTNSTWTETNVTWNNVGSRASTATDTKTLTDSAWSAFDITALVKQWKNGTYNANCGFIMIGASENSLDKSFCSSEHEKTTYRPYVVVNYTEDGGSISASTNRVNEGAYLQLSAPGMTGAVTWTSSNTNIATVTSEGIVEGVHAGQVTITAQAEGYTDCTFSLWVTLPDGIYYFNNADSNLSMYNNKSSNVYAESQVTTDPYRVYRLWKTQYVSDGMYLLQPLHDASVYLTTDSSGSVYVAEMPQSVAGSSAKWKIAWNAFGYAISYLGSSYRSLQTSSTGGNAAPLVIAGTWQAGFIYNWIPVSADGVFLRDTATLETITSSAAFNIELGQSSTLDDFGLAPEYYGDVQGVSWSSNNLSVAEVNTSGEVSSLRCGQTRITLTSALDGKTYSQSFAVYVHLPDGTYMICNKELHKYMQIDDDCYTDFTVNGATMELWPYSDVGTKKWIITHLDGLYYSIQSVESGLALTVPSGYTNSGASALEQQAYTGSDTQKWEIIASSNGAYVIRAKSAKNLTTDWCMSAGKESGDNVVYYVEQKPYTADTNYMDEWHIAFWLNIGMSTDNYTNDSSCSKRSSYRHANAFYNALEVPSTKVHHYNYGVSNTASKSDFAESGAISNNTDFMIYMGHGHSADNDNEPKGNHLHYSYSSTGAPVTTGDCDNEIYNLYSSEVSFGSSTSDLRWVWLYTCNFLTTGTYVSNDSLKDKMTGAHIVMGYASQSFLCDPMVETFAEYLRNGETIIDSYFAAGYYSESQYATDNHIQKILYIPQAEFETIYSPPVHYEYDPSDVLIITHNIDDVYIVD